MGRIGTARTRLAAGYAALVLVTAAALIVVFNLLLEHNLRTSGPHGRGLVGSAAASEPRPDPATESRFFELTRDQILRDQWVVSGLTIGGLTLVSVAVGWLVAGRVLRPLHRITATARRLSLSNLHERIALTGPRDELTELADTFDSMLDRLQHAAEAQRRFVANASHELRTPLAVQRTAIQVGLERPSPERLAEVRAELLTLNRRSERLIDGLLVLAQSEKGLSTADPIALHEVARQVVHETPPSHVTIRAELAPVTVLGDPALVNRLVANLVENAVKYNVPDGTVDVQTTADGLLSVRNTGPRIPPDQVSSLFEPFRRIPPRTRAAEAATAGRADAAGQSAAGQPAVSGRLDVGRPDGADQSVTAGRSAAGQPAVSGRLDVGRPDGADQSLTAGRSAAGQPAAGRSGSGHPATASRSDAGQAAVSGLLDIDRPDGAGQSVTAGRSAASQPAVSDRPDADRPDSAGQSAAGRSGAGQAAVSGRPDADRPDGAGQSAAGRSGAGHPAASQPPVTNRPDGAGLGLSIVAAIARAHGADIEAQAGEDGGLHVRVRLPLAPPAPPNAPTAPTAQRLRPTAA